MALFSPRPLRIESEYRVEIRLQENGGGGFLPGICEGILVNVSREGACIVLSQMLLEGRHLFFSTLNSERYHLVLLIKNPQAGDECFEVPARSAWMDSCYYKDGPAFKIGVCFHDRQKQLFQLFKG